MTSIKAIAPTRTVDSEFFWDSCRDGRLMLPRCMECQRLFYYPRNACPHCGSQKLGWHEASGKGTIHSFTHVHVSFYGPEWEQQLPYTPILVDLAEGPRMLSRLVGDDRGEVRIGEHVQVVFVPADKDRIPYFRRSQLTQGTV